MNSLIGRLVAVCARHAAATLLGTVILAGLSLDFSVSHLKIDTDNSHLFDPALPWRQVAMAQSRDFPQFDNITLTVVKGATPEEAEETANALAAAADADKLHFHDATAEGRGAFFAHNGLLLLPEDRLEALLTKIIETQPFLGQLAADPSARGLFNAIALLAQGAQSDQVDLAAYGMPLSIVRDTLNDAAAGHPTPLSWSSLIGGGLANSTVFVVLHPVLDHGSMQQGKAATAALEAIAAKLPDVMAGRAKLGITGEVPLTDQQFASLTDGLAIGTTIMLLLITLWLFLALRSVRLILAVLGTLVLGLIFTLFFATVAIGTLNLISVAFAILFVGLAVDFAIQFSVQFRNVAFRHGGTEEALRLTADEAGGQIALAAAATACGFLAFAPTSFLGVAELGIIAGTGMIIAFVCTVTILPAAIALFAIRSAAVEVALAGGAAVDGALMRHRRPVLALCALSALLGGWAAAATRFDANPLDTMDPDSPAMRTLAALVSNPAANPFFATAMAPDLKAARTLAARLSGLPGVGMVLSGATFVPEDQAAKLGMIAQTRTILASTLLAVPDQAQPGVADLRAAMKQAAEAIGKAAPKLPKDSPLLGIGTALERLQAAPDSVVEAANVAVARFLPAQLAALTDALNPSEITQARLPPEIRNDWFTSRGEVMVKVVPVQATGDTVELLRFVREVQAVAPKAGGPAVTTLASAATILGAFRTASILAALAISAILFLVFRTLRDVALVISALILSALLTALFGKLLGVQLNFANIIALPLLLGVGVSFNVYFVMNWRSGMRSFLGSATARAILFSALTTGTAFGSLAASHDPGMSSLGIVLLLSLASVLISTFVYLPALLLEGRRP